MPLPKTRDVGKLVNFLKKDKPGMSQEQRTAIALSQARKSGADIPEPKMAEGGEVPQNADDIIKEMAKRSHIKNYHGGGSCYCYGGMTK